ncbi:MAG TPA: HAD-IA family hydrolase [Candidatus Limnocylindria bacterium]|nr:HAD-IA family hydrolase [Candidatus Limnocylindria bacterium]
MGYRLVCLDAGFTLLSPRRTLAQSLSGVLAQHGHQVDDADLQAAWEAADRWFWDEYARPDNSTWGDDAKIEATWRDYHALMLHELGLDEQRKLLDLVLASQFAADAWEPYPDVIPMLERLRALDGLRIGIVSDWGSNLEPIVQSLGLDRYLDFVLASGAVGLAKPDPAFFALAASRAGVSPQQALMVGDSYRADVLGARSAGMDGVLIDRQGNVTADDVTIMRSLDELPAIVRNASAPGSAGSRKPSTTAATTTTTAR